MQEHKLGSLEDEVEKGVECKKETRNELQFAKEGQVCPEGGVEVTVCGLGCSSGSRVGGSERGRANGPMRNSSLWAKRGCVQKKWARANERRGEVWWGVVLCGLRSEPQSLRHRREQN